MGSIRGLSLSVDTIKIVEENNAYYMFDESLKSEVSELGFEEIVILIFLGLTILYQVLLIKILMLVLLCWSTI